MGKLDLGKIKLYTFFFTIIFLIGTSSSIVLYIDYTNQERDSGDKTELELAQSFGPIFPRFNRAPVLYVVNVTDLPYDKTLILASLQGLVNRDAAELYLEYGKTRWLNFLNQTYGQAFEYISFDEALIKFKAKASGMVIYNPEATATVNVATSMAGIDDLIIVSPDLRVKVSSLTGLNVSLDLRKGNWATFSNGSKIYIEVLEQLYPSLNQNIFGMLRPGKTTLRDYLIATNAMCVSINPGPLISPEEDDVVNKILETTTTHSTVLGWFFGQTGMEENIGTQRISRAGKVVLPADQIPNLSVFAAYDFKNPPKISDEKPQSIPKLENKIYLTFVVSDGDNLGFMHNTYSDIWSNADRGKFPLGWSMSPIAAEIAPPLFEFYSESATENDSFVCGPSGAGLFYPDFYPDDDLGPLLARTNELMNLSGLEIIWLLNSYTPYEVKYSDRVLNAYTDYIKPNGIFLDYGDVPFTKQYWISEGEHHAGTPIIRATHMWEDLDNFIAKVEVGADSTKDRPFFIFAAVHVWTLGPKDVKEVIERLKINDPESDYKVVSPVEFCKLMQIAEIEKAKKNINSLDEWPYKLDIADKSSIESHVEKANSEFEKGEFDSAANHAAKANNIINEIKVNILTSLIILFIIILTIVVYLLFYLDGKRKLRESQNKLESVQDTFLSSSKYFLKNSIIFPEIFMLFLINTVVFSAVYRVLFSNLWDWPAIGISIFIALGFVPLTKRKSYKNLNLTKRLNIGLIILFIFSLGLFLSTYFLPIILLGFMIILESAPYSRTKGIIFLLPPMVFGMLFANVIWTELMMVILIGFWAICFGFTFEYYERSKSKIEISNLKNDDYIHVHTKKDKSKLKIEYDAPIPPTLFIVISLLIIYIPFSRYLNLKLGDLYELLVNVTYIIPITAAFIAYPIAYKLRMRMVKEKNNKYPTGFRERAVVISIAAFVFGAIFFTWEPLIVVFLILIGEICIMTLALITMPQKWLSTFPQYLARDFVILFLLLNLVFLTPVITYTLYFMHLGFVVNYILYAFPISFAIGLIIMIIPVAYYWRKQENIVKLR
jgi:hypothetical protein